MVIILKPRISNLVRAELEIMVKVLHVKKARVHLSLNEVVNFSNKCDFSSKASTDLLYLSKTEMLFIKEVCFQVQKPEERLSLVKCVLWR